MSLINPHDIKISDDHYSSERHIKHQAMRLEVEGQIEPILLNEDNTLNENGWTYAGAQVLAARRLNWETVLVTYKDVSM